MQHLNFVCATSILNLLPRGQLNFKKHGVSSKISGLRCCESGSMASEDISSFTSAVEVKTFARLHMGFFDLNGSLGRRFGSIGSSINAPYTEIVATRHVDILVEGPGCERAKKLARSIINALQLDSGLHIKIKQAIPEHAGLGSGTQMSLAVGSAVSKLYGLKLSVQQIANITSRGARSGIGLGTFDMGGVIVDGGRGAETLIPPVIAHVDFPKKWSILLIFDHSNQGVHGANEVAAFKSLPTFSESLAADLCRRVLMQALPALMETDLKSFGAAIKALQEATGDYFAPVQGGRYASPLVTEVLEYLEAEGVQCLGQSSWGPTGFAVFADESSSRVYLNHLQSRYQDQTLSFQLCKGLNRGSFVRTLDKADEMNI